MVISFHPEVTELAKRRLPDHEVLLVVEQTASTEGLWSPTVEEIPGVAVRQELDGLDLLNTTAADRDSIQRFFQAGLSTAVWTVNSVADARRLMDAGVRSLTTDDPRKLIAGLR